MSRKQQLNEGDLRSKKSYLPAILFLFVTVCFLIVLVGMFNRFMSATQASEASEEAVEYLTNDGLHQFVTDYFTKYDAAEMIPIIECESQFRHFEEDGTVLKNMQGSSAIGIAQIMSSLHPDPQVLLRYNRRNLTNFKVEDFDITTLRGNVWYALVLYKTRGTQDWECSKLI